MQRFIAGRYTSPIDAASATGVPHDKLTSRHPFATDPRAFAMLFVFCLSPASDGSNVMKVRRIGSSIQTLRRHNWTSRLASLVAAAVRRIVGGGLIQFAIKRGAANFQSASDL